MEKGINQFTAVAALQGVDLLEGLDTQKTDQLGTETCPASLRKQVKNRGLKLSQEALKVKECPNVQHPQTHKT